MRTTHHINIKIKRKITPDDLDSLYVYEQMALAYRREALARYRDGQDYHTAMFYQLIALMHQDTARMMSWKTNAKAFDVYCSLMGYA